MGRARNLDKQDGVDIMVMIVSLACLRMSNKQAATIIFIDIGEILNIDV